MEIVKRPIRWLFDSLERALSGVFPPAWNPLLNLGALGFFFYWIITVSGIYVYIFFDTGITQAYGSVEYMTNDQWYAAGVMRSLHRYASDGLIVVMLVHILREFALDHARGVRWFSWMTGVPVLIMVYAAGISGYWLVWDKLAQYVAIVSTEWLDMLPFFGQPIARNFLSPDALESRFFTLMIFMHIAVPLIALFVLWLHLQRVSKPRINPPLGLVIGTGLSLLVLSFIYPATSQGPANLAEVPGRIGLDWFYLPAYPLIDTLPGQVTWSAALAFLVIMVGIPWMPPLKRMKPATVNLDNCNGCSRCAEDCPYTAITMQQRSDGLPFEGEAVVDPSLCVSCGICAGSCPTSTPFRRMSDLVPGIDLPDRSIAAIRAEVDREGQRLTGPGRIMVFGCINGARLEGLQTDSRGVISINCTGHLPPAFIDYILSRNLADGVVVAGCAENACYNRLGGTWTAQRIARVRDPQLRSRVPRERLRTIWAGRNGLSHLVNDLEGFAETLRQMPAAPRQRGRPRDVEPERQDA
ncbi:MAG: cytochrome b N-terminal domain-containing protein [Alphaproteobacteria bacterium]|nr:cytochrome b N-terminal domain-containing protein [Alphaproteobacteria bacterium]